LDPGQEITFLNKQAVFTQVNNPSGIGSWNIFCVLEEQFGSLWQVQDAWGGERFSCTIEYCGQATCGSLDDGPVNLQAGVLGGQWTPVTLTNMFIRVPANALPEGSTVQLSGRASFGNGTSQNFTNTAWTNFPPIGVIGTNGVLQIGSVSQNTTMAVSAPYVYQGTPGTVTTNITVINLPPPQMKSVDLQSSRQLKFTLQGVPNRRHLVQASGNLTVWTNLATCVLDANGTFIFTDTNAPGEQKFYRALELP
jgi:hypothetical protein